jgi:predicted nucleotidyltransferase
MALSPYSDVRVNPLVGDVLSERARHYMGDNEEYGGFRGVALFGSQASGKWRKNSDADMGLIYSAEGYPFVRSMVSDDLFHSLIPHGVRMCPHNEPSRVHLNVMANPDPKKLAYLCSIIEDRELDREKNPNGLKNVSDVLCDLTCFCPFRVFMVMRADC